MQPCRSLWAATAAAAGEAALPAWEQRQRKRPAADDDHDAWEEWESPGKRVSPDPAGGSSAIPDHCSTEPSSNPNWSAAAAAMAQMPASSGGARPEAAAAAASAAGLLPASGAAPGGVAPLAAPAAQAGVARPVPGAADQTGERAAKVARIQAMREEIAAHRRVIATLEALVAQAEAELE